MRKWMILLVLCLFCMPAFAESTDDIELFPCIGASTRKEVLDMVDEAFMKGIRGKDGGTVYLGESYASCVAVKYAHEECEETYGWDHETVYYISLSMSGYSLNGIRVGDKAADVDAVCLEDGWVKMNEAPLNCDAGYEKTMDGVKYTLAYIIEYGTDWINHVHVKAEHLSF